MADTLAYEPPKVWTWERESGGRFASINRPISGFTHEAELPCGRHPLQLYSLATPNGVKVTVMLEELLAAGFSGAEYDAYVINIGEGDQFGSGFVAINPNSKIPALMDHSQPTPTRVFESGAILLYLAEKFGAFIPEDPSERAECLSVAVLADGLGTVSRRRFRATSMPMRPPNWSIRSNRYTMEVKRQLDVLDKRLAETRYIAGDTVHHCGHRDLAVVRRTDDRQAL